MAVGFEVKSKSAVLHRVLQNESSRSIWQIDNDALN
jgi:hypothetical protein